MVDSTNLNHSEQGTWEKWKAFNCISRSNEINLNVAATHVGKNKAFKHNFFETAKKTQNNTTFLGTERPEAVFGFGWVANVGRKRWDF